MNLADSFITQNSTGDTKVYISPAGNMCIGVACSTLINLSASCNPATEAFVVQVGTTNMIYIDFAGRFYAVGELYKNQNTLE